MRYIDKFSTSGDVQTAINNGTLLKPYVAYVEASESLDWNTKEPPHDYSKDYLTFEILSDGDIMWTAHYAGINYTIQYKLNNGEWTSITSNVGEDTPTISVKQNDKILFKGNRSRYGGSYENIYAYFKSTCNFEVYGNIMSLIYSDNFIGQTIFPSSESNYTFNKLFSDCSGLTSAEHLVLPATVLTDSCYYYMFNNCTNLTTAPALPATTLNAYCYCGMFRGCTSLTAAPELPSTTLKGTCYQSMFYDCSSLNYIKCLATDISAINCTRSWVDGVSSTGTFVKKAGVTWPSGASGIPNNWTVVEV